MQKNMKRAPKLTKDWKYYTGMSCMVCSLILPLMGFLVPLLDLPVPITAGIIGALAVGGPEIMILLGVLLLGKKTAQYYKEKFFAFFKRRPGPHKKVSKGRYYFGLVMLWGSVLPLYLAGFFPQTMPADEDVKYFILVGADLIFVLSFFVLGGDFWDKFKALFVWEKTVKRL